MLNNAISYCSEKVCADGSSMHYALLFQTEANKAFWLGCFTLAFELRQASMKQLDAGLTQVKLGWWRNALVQSKKTAPQHPVLQAISQAVLKAIEEETWAELITQIANSCEVRRFNSIQDWHSANCVALKPWLAIVREKTRQDQPEALGALLEFWAFSVQLCQLLKMAKYLDEGFQPIPIQLLAHAGVTAEHIKNREHSERTQALFLQLGTDLIDQANQAWQRLPRPLALFARPLRALFRMRVAEFELHGQSAYHLLSEEKKITPLKKFTVSWTTQVLRW